TAKRLVLGTSLESPIKRAHYQLTRSKSSLYDVQTIAIMRQVLRPDSWVVDVGAYEGSMLRHMLRFAPKGRHVAAEPIPALAARLRDRFPGCTIVEAALGETRGVQSFVEVASHPALSGLRRRIDLPEATSTRTYDVRIETLDAIVGPDAPVAFVKIDV